MKSTHKVFCVDVMATNIIVTAMLMLGERVGLSFQCQ